MSRVGKKPITIPSGVTATLADTTLTVKGPKGELSLQAPKAVQFTLNGAELTVAVLNPEVKIERSLWGTYRKLAANMIEGVSKGFETKMEMVGVGYKASVAGDTLTLEVGFSHPVIINLPVGIKAVVEKTIMTLTGIDKQMLGQVVANIRKTRPPEPYKGKGIKFVGELIRRKAGKAAKAGAK